MSRIEVVYTASRNLYPYLMASVRSLLDYNPDARVWMLIEDDRLPYDVPWNVEVVNVGSSAVRRPVRQLEHAVHVYVAAAVRLLQNVHR